VSDDGRSAVRHRNAEAILDAALDALVADPAAGMGEIAARAGVGRATLYRHYATREALIAALQDRVRGAFRRLQLELVASTEPDALERFVADLLVLREGWSVIRPGARPEARMREVWHPVLEWVEREQRAGTIDPDLPADWVLALLRATLRAAALELDAGALTPEAAPALVVRGFRRGTG